MSRTIRFRAWNKKGKCWITFGGVNYRYENGILDIVDSDNLIYEQYTGLTDKNGKGIYEGDVVRIVRSYGYGFLPKGAKAVVKFDEKELCYKLMGQGEYRLTANKKVEVIGNIHESNMEEENEVQE